MSLLWLFKAQQRRDRIEVLIETFIRKQLGLKAHTVTQVVEGEDEMVISIDRELSASLCREEGGPISGSDQREEYGSFCP